MRDESVCKKSHGFKSTVIGEFMLCIDDIFKLWYKMSMQRKVPHALPWPPLWAAGVMKWECAFSGIKGEKEKTLPADLGVNLSLLAAHTASNL